MPNHAVVRIAAVRFEGGFAIDDFMRDVASRLRAEGVRLAGAVQENLPAGDGTPCAAMVLTDLRSQRRLRISQDLGAEATACRLDAGGLAEVGTLLERSIDGETDLMLLNRFGVAEAEGHGLRAVLAHALEAGIPVLTAVRPPYDAAWAEFHGGLASDLPAEREAVLAWCRAAVRAARAARASEVAARGAALS